MRARAAPAGLLPAALLAAGCALTGGPVPGAPAHHREGGFANLNPGYTRPPRWAMTKFFARRVWNTTFAASPTIDLPPVADAAAGLGRGSHEPTVTWVGHATLLVQLGGLRILLDPHWSNRASPLSFAGPRRVTPPGLDFEALPPVDVVVISHDHYDHLDRATVERLARTHRPRFLVPLGLRAWFADLGIGDVEELDWWESRTLGGITFTCLPAQHFSGRGLFDRNRRLWASWAVAGGGRRLYFSGDTGYWPPLFREVGRRAGPFDLAAVAIGAYEPAVIMEPNHVTPDEALRLAEDIRARRVLGVHWGTFDLAEEPLADPPRRLEAARVRRGLDPDRVWVFRPGETRRW